MYHLINWKDINGWMDGWTDINGPQNLWMHFSREPNHYFDGFAKSQTQLNH